MNVGQFISELEEYDREMIVKLDGDRDITNIEIMDDGNVLIEGEHDGTE